MTLGPRFHAAGEHITTYTFISGRHLHTIRSKSNVFSTTAEKQFFKHIKLTSGVSKIVFNKKN